MAQQLLQLHSLACNGCNAKTPSMFDKCGDISVRVRQSKASDGIVRREVLCDWCASRRSDLI